MANVLVVANETIGSKALLDAVRERAEPGDASFSLVVPQNRPKHGGIIYDEAVRHAAEVRIDLARQFLKDEGIDIVGDVGDPDPFQATMDAIADFRADEIIVSTYPVTASGWLRRDLIQRIEGASGLPVKHVVSDVEAEGMPFHVTLVVANRTGTGEEVVETLHGKAGDGQKALFIVAVPQDDGSGHAAQTARRRLNAILVTLRGAGLLCAGMIGDPDPYTAAMNALQSFRVDDVVISTLPKEKSGWLRSDLVGRIRTDSGLPVEHVVVDMDAARATA